MKKITQEQHHAILNEIKNIINEISPANKTTTIKLKQGGYNGAASPSTNTIWIRIDTWLNHSLIAKRLLLIHEILHLKGLHHSAQKLYSNAGIDLLTLASYELIYGLDEEYTKVYNGVKSMAKVYFDK